MRSKREERPTMHSTASRVSETTDTRRPPIVGVQSDEALMRQPLFQTLYPAYLTNTTGNATAAIGGSVKLKLLSNVS